MQSVPEELHLMEETYARAVSEELKSMRRTQFGEVGRGASPMGETPQWNGGRV